jgi:thioesterase domain-containing protein
MVIVPSRDGHFDKWRSLLTVVARDRAVHGLEVVGGQPYWMENPSLEEIAEGFTRLLIERSPRQGFHLFGYSFGGVLAYEIGRQLAEHGLPPLSVTLLDSVANAGPAPWRLRDAASMAANAPRLWIFNMRTYPARNVARRAARLMCFWRWWRRSRLSAEMPEKAEAEERPSINGELPSLYRQRRAVAARALCAYRPRPTGNRIVYVRSRVRRLIHRRRADGGWGRLVPDHALTIRHLSGNHVSALEPQRQRELAVIIEECLRNVDQSAQSPSSRKAA